VSDEFILSTDMKGRSDLVALPRLRPLEYNEDVEVEDALNEFVQSKAFNLILDRLKRGERPSRQLALDAIKLLLKKPGHAVAAIRLIDRGPLIDHVLVINSWGTFEVHSPSSFVDQLNYVLVSPRS
jgi:hypothetical protein